MAIKSLRSFQRFPISLHQIIVFCSILSKKPERNDLNGDFITLRIIAPSSNLSKTKVWGMMERPKAELKYRFQLLCHK